MKTLALFDFDGTLTREDTLPGIIKYQKGRFNFWFGMIRLSPIILGYWLRLIPNWKAKEKLLSFFFRNEQEDVFQKKCNHYALEEIPGILRPEGLKVLKSHIEKGHRVIVVSASAVNWVKPWCDSLQIEVIATRLVVRDGKLTGRILGKNCYGPEKVRRINQELDPTEYDDIYAYGNGKGDYQMLELATHPHLKPF